MLYFVLYCIVMIYMEIIYYHFEPRALGGTHAKGTNHQKQA